MARGLFRCPYSCPLETCCTPFSQRHELDIESEYSEPIRDRRRLKNEQIRGDRERVADQGRSRL